MKKFATLKKSILICSAVAALTVSCRDKEKDAEAREEDKVGNVYNSEEQGVDIENRDNQFPSTRNDNVEGEGQETGAPTDTVDGDGDKGVKMPQQQTPEQRRQ